MPLSASASMSIVAALPVRIATAVRVTISNARHDLSLDRAR
jgi:hypothetical protein